jgi:broad specificity phosphatase PhoE
MKYIELRRNSLREGGKGLGAYGVQLARQSRPNLASAYQFVLSSPKKRCAETAVAFGFDHFFTDSRLGPLDRSAFDGLEKKIEKRHSAGLPWIEAAFQMPACRPILKKLATEAFAAIDAAVSFLPDEGRALVVTHGELLEALALLCYPTYHFSHIGRAFGPCEGVELTFDGEFVSALAIRLGLKAEAEGQAAVEETADASSSESEAGEDAETEAEIETEPEAAAAA